MSNRAAFSGPVTLAAPAFAKDEPKGEQAARKRALRETAKSMGPVLKARQTLGVKPVAKLSVEEARKGYDGVTHEVFGMAPPVPDAAKARTLAAKDPKDAFAADRATGATGTRKKSAERPHAGESARTRRTGSLGERARPPASRRCGRPFRVASREILTDASRTPLIGPARLRPTLRWSIFERGGSRLA